MTRRFSTETAAETQELAKQLLLDILSKRTRPSKLEQGMEVERRRIVLLSGPLGSGKTTFVKGLAKALDIEQTIKSPTYTYVNTYEIKKRGNEEKIDPLFPRFLVHYDLYRLPEYSDHPERTAAEIGLEEALHDPHAIVVIEWPERLPIPKPCLLLQFEKKNNHHFISVKEQLHELFSFLENELH